MVGSFENYLKGKIAMRLLYGTGNPAKLSAMSRRLQPLGIEVIGLGDLRQECPTIVEDGNTPLENARKKAIGYWNAFHMPVFSCDSGLYFDGVSEEEQPGIHVRTVNGTYLSDQEMLEHYSALAKKYGSLTARYRNAICFVMDEKSRYEAMDPSMESRPFRIVPDPHPMRRKGFPLDSLSVEITSGKYYYDLEDTELDQVAVEDGFLTFFAKILG